MEELTHRILGNCGRGQARLHYRSQVRYHLFVMSMPCAKHPASNAVKVIYIKWNSMRGRRAYGRRNLGSSSRIDAPIVTALCVKPMARPQYALFLAVDEEIMRTEFGITNNSYTALAQEISWFWRDKRSFRIFP